MAVIEQEVVEQDAVREIRIPISREQEEALTRAAFQAGQSLEEFAASALMRAAEAVLHPAPPAIPRAQSDPLDSIFGIFKDEPLLDALMERIHQEQQRGIEQFRLEAEAEDAKAQNAEAQG